MIVKLKKEQKIKITQAKDIFPIMKEILLRENEYGVVKVKRELKVGQNQV